MSELSPIVWLWEELRTLLPADQYDELRARYSVVYKRYTTAARLRQAQRELAHYERMQSAASSDRWYRIFDRKIANRKATIAKLETLLAEGNSTEE